LQEGRSLLRSTSFRLFAFVIAFFASTFAAASAHPLGNLTINHLSELRVAADRIDVRYVLDMAEIPTYQAMRAADPSGSLAGSALAAWGRGEARTLLPELHLTRGDRSLPLRLTHERVTTRPGAGGLPTLYLVIDAAASSRGAGLVAYRDMTFPGRLGWKDVVVSPQAEPTHELLAYPSQLLGSPRDTTAVAFDVRPGGGVVMAAAAPVAAVAAAGPSSSSLGRSNQLSDMIARGTSDPRLIALTFVVAIVLGAAHALEPGHGKTLLAISLVGARATVRQAGILAAALTFAHTAGVLGIGLLLNAFAAYLEPEQIYPWIQLLSGIAIAVIGARALQRQLAARRPFAHAHAHAHPAAHAHAHPHVHGSGDPTHEHGAHGAHDDLDDEAHALAHAIPGSKPLAFWPTTIAAMSGSIAPCPAAIVVLLAALALHQMVYGVLVIVAFSFGLAGTLTTIGIAVVRGAVWLQRRSQYDAIVRYGPLVSAIFISAIGAVMIGQGFAQQPHSSIPSALITILVVLAITGFGFSHPGGHRHAEAA